VNPPEDQLRLAELLRDAYREAAEAVGPQAARGLPGRGRPAAPAARPARRGPRIGIPAVAAVAVAVILLLVAVVAPRLLARPAARGRPTSGPPPATGAPAPLAGGVPAPLAGGVPRFYAAVLTDSRSPLVHGTTVLEILSTVTGRAVGELPVRRPGTAFQTVTAISNDSFVAVAGPVPGTGRPCVSWLYRFRLTAQGRPADVTRLAAVAGSVPLYQLAASADGRVIAYVRSRCGAALGHGQLVVAHLGRHGVSRRAWTETDTIVPLNLSLSADGQQLGVMAAQVIPKKGLLYGAWTMSASAPPGPLARQVRVIVTPSASLQAAVLSRTSPEFVGWLFDQFDTHGQMKLATYAVGGRGTPLLVRPFGFAGLTSPPKGRAPFGAYLSGTDVYIPITTRTQHLFETYIAAQGITPDSSGRYVLMFGWQSRTAYLDLATGRLTTPAAPVPASAGRVRSAAW
jgi:hypothetical protein